MITWSSKPPLKKCWKVKGNFSPNSFRRLLFLPCPLWLQVMSRPLGISSFTTKRPSAISDKVGQTRVEIRPGAEDYLTRVAWKWLKLFIPAIEVMIMSCWRIKRSEKPFNWIPSRMSAVWLKPMVQHHWCWRRHAPLGQSSLAEHFKNNKTQSVVWSYSRLIYLIHLLDIQCSIKQTSKRKEWNYKMAKHVPFLCQPCK